MSAGVAQAAGDIGPGGITGWIAKGITAAINAFFEGLVGAALNPLLKLLEDTLLTTPTPASLPRVGELWAHSWEITIACYSLLVMVAGVLLMAHESVQTRYSVRELAPRVPLGFLAAALSLFLAGKAVELANALSTAVAGGGLGKKSAGTALHQFVRSSFSPSGGIFVILMWGVVAVVLVALLVSYVVRVALTILLIAGAPLALMCHALPVTDGVARWWWRIFGGVLSIQIAQSMALVVSIRVFLTPGNFSPFGATRGGLVSVLVVLALVYIIFKIPFWILGSVRVGHGRSFVGRMIRAAVVYKTFGLLRGAPRRVASVHAVRGGSVPASGAGSSSGQGASAGARRRQAPGSPQSGQRTSGGPRLGRRALAGPRRPPGPPVFLPPTQSAQAPGSPSPAAAPGARRAAGPPPMPRFLAPGGPPGAATPGPRPTAAPGPPVFRPPGGASGSAARPVSPPSRAPGPPRFQGPVPQQPPVRPLRAAQRPAPPAFRPPPPAGGPQQRRTPLPPPGGSYRPGGERR
ncbi:hypothetical protein AB0G73_27870 [Streptomyces sp. NPDC020719]|uniref:hypothetical protein n=1 Tax=Streptomyces sp. NPDC020719 TaxID=3154896 RepID=UPI0033FFEA42